MNEASTLAPIHPLRNHAFFLLWIGSSVSAIGDQFYFLALPWMVLELTGSSIVLGTISVIAAIPSAIFMLLGGVLTDRLFPRKIIIITAAARFILLVFISARLWMHSLALYELFVLAACFGIADAFSYPAFQSFLPSLVISSQLPAANSVSQSTTQITTLIVPGLAGFFIKTFGSAWMLFIDAMSFLFIIGMLWRLPDPPSVATRLRHGNLIRSILDGLQYVRSDIALSSLMLVIAVLNFATAGPIGIGIAFIAKREFGSVSSFGFLLSGMAAGSLAGTLLAGFSRQRKRGMLLLLVSTTIGICLGAVGILHGMPALLAVLSLLGGAAAFLNVQLIAWFQQHVDRAMMGRVMSVRMFSAIGLTPFSLAIAGIAMRWSPSGLFLLNGGMVLLVTLLAAIHRPVREID
ncbi:MAG TPA: MFS transporter [Candidatus Angelobacter sp.]